MNDAYRIGDAVLRIVREDGDKECDDEAAREAAVVPLALQAGVKTPELIAADPTAQHAPRPYTLYRRAAGTLMGYSDRHPSTFQHAYRELGREILKIAGIPTPEGPVWHYRSGDLPNPRQSLETTLAAGAISEPDALEIGEWLDEVEPAMQEPEQPVLLHNDLHPWNLMVDPDTHQLTAILDWGDAGPGDPAREFCSMPVLAIESMIEGYVEAGGRWTDPMALRARMYGLELALWELRSLDRLQFKPTWWRFPEGGWRGLVG